MAHLLTEINRVKSFNEREAQGLTYAHDDIWFLSSRNCISKWRVTGSNLYEPDRVESMKSDVTRSDLHDLVRYNMFDPGYDHIGDIDYHKGLIFAPVEYQNYRRPALLMAFSDDLQLIGYALLPGGYTTCPFCAINPKTGLLYLLNNRHRGLLDAFDVSHCYEVSSQ